MDQNSLLLNRHVNISSPILHPNSSNHRRRPPPLRPLIRLPSAVVYHHSPNRVYSFCDGPKLSRGPYLGIATVCSVASLVFVSLKASYVFMSSNSYGGGYVKATEMALFLSSLGLAIGHVVVAYRTSCRERRKLLVYKIDIEAVSQISLSFSFSPTKKF
ncbi:hypothetical protein ACJIZ3_022338 [Penstemon smallii]|uniref:Uncharacterized protein n=1 Tax=Penstemon smallii TaxID=265156 RepID=A0ABD3TLW0_9LAMI